MQKQPECYHEYEENIVLLAIELLAMVALLTA